ncbi:MAG TPA: hypothetical protein VHJ76_07105 [Actinomycetota bacterium]|nr:hypothetical protein [Actinomycetota bacterium]
MTRAAALVLAAGTFAGCARAPSLDPAAKERLDDARESAAEAVAAVDDLEDRIAELEDDLDDAGRVSERVDRVTERLWDSLAKLRKSLDEAEAGASDASATAGAALGRAEQAARDLAVLGNRYDYHLRRYHGGG